MSTFIHEPFGREDTADFVAGWNACLASANADGSSAFHEGWMACCAAASKDNGSFLDLKPRVYVRMREAPPYNPFKRWL